MRGRNEEGEQSAHKTLSRENSVATVTNFTSSRNWSKKGSRQNRDQTELSLWQRGEIPRPIYRTHTAHRCAHHHHHPLDISYRLFYHALTPYLSMTLVKIHRCLVWPGYVNSIGQPLLLLAGYPPRAQVIRS